MFSKACEYGIKAIIYIAQKDSQGERVSLKAIARAIDSPVAFTAKILQALTHAGFLHSTKGPSGGFELARAAEHISLAEIVASIDGDEIFRGCGLGLKECDSTKPCPIHFKFVKLRDELESMLSNTSLFELSSGLVSGESFLKR